MSNAATQSRLSYAEYLAVEEISPVKHVYMGGEVFAMSGGRLTTAPWPWP